MPHAAGSALARGRTNIAGAIIPTLDNEIFAAQMEPGLTTMRVDNARIGSLAADYLLARLSGETPSPVPPLVPEFIERGSTAPPR
jgi:LacI family transcriptional regulator